MALAIERPKPIVFEDVCKGCGRCIPACSFQCIEIGDRIHAATGLVPVHISLDRCTACGLCFDACPEPYGLQPALHNAVFATVTKKLAATADRAGPEAIPDIDVLLPEGEAVVIKGMHASAIGAILGGCRHFFGYPITPSTEGAELLARLLPQLDGQFLQSVSELAAINSIYGAAAAGVPAATFTSSPGFSLMLEGLSYMIGAQLPGVVVNVMRGGPGLGNIAPAQSDIKLACRGLGHGDTHGIVLAPSTPQEMLDLTMLAFRLAFKHRNPVIVLADGYLGQMTGKVVLPRVLVKPGVPAWAVTGDDVHRRNLVSSISLSAADLEDGNLALLDKYARISSTEQRSDQFQCADADVLLIACNTPARMAKGAVRTLRERGYKVGLFRPLTLWPFPIDALAPLVERATRVVVVEASAGQLEDEVRLARSHAGIVRSAPLERVSRCGGILPSHDEIVARVINQPMKADAGDRKVNAGL